MSMGGEFTLTPDPSPKGEGSEISLPWEKGDEGHFLWMARWPMSLRYCMPSKRMPAATS